MPGTPGADQLQALINLSNDTTGASDAKLSDAVATLIAGYGGGGNNFASGTFTPDEDIMSDYTVTDIATLGFTPNLFLVKSDYTSSDSITYGIVIEAIVNNNEKACKYFTRYTNTSGGFYTGTSVSAMTTRQGSWMYFSSSGNIIIAASSNTILLSGVTYTWYAIA